MDGEVRMKRLLLVAIPVALLVAQTGDPKRFAVWTAADIHGRAAQLATHLDAMKSASESLADYGHYRTMVAHREGSGGAELHEKWADLFVVEEGSAMLVVGGEIEGGKAVSPGEIRGTSISGGTRHALAKGDVVSIPANTPHQLLLDAGAKFTYFVVKVESR